MRSADHIQEALTGDELVGIWNALQSEYFPDQLQLLDYRVRWSDRSQTRMLGSCNVRTRSISIARAMGYSRYRWLLSPLLYHEMCHAVLGMPRRVGKRRSIHGRDFQLLEKRHPFTPLLDNWIRTGGWQEAVHHHRRRKRPSRFTFR